MKREVDLQRRLHSLSALGEAVTAMKSLSARHFRASRAALAPAHVYAEGINHLLESTGAFLPGADGPSGLLVIGAELGLCGGYNARVTAAAIQRRAELGAGPTLCVGHRAAALFGRQGGTVDRAYPAPTSVGGITDSLLIVAQDMLGDYVTQRMSCFEVVSCRFEGVGAYRPVTTRLLPTRAAPSPGAPTVRYAQRDRVSVIAVRELLYITLYELLLDALASEHGARLAATQSAEEWLTERIERLRRHLAAARREASTQEVIEIAAGARARDRAKRSGAPPVR